jgi:FecR protein
MARSLAHFFDDASFDFGGVHKVIVAADGDGPITVPDAHLLFSGEFNRSGSDLIIHGDHGDSVVVTGYFSNGEPAALRSPDGAILDAKVVQLLAGSANPGVYAQAGAAPASGPAAIGKIEQATGSVTVTHADGTVVAVKVGDLVHKGDVVQTGGDGAVGIGFTDGTAFNLSADARMALNEFVYDPNGSANKAFISLVQGTFGFLAGKVAKTGDMKVDTPVATMGIRGTAVYSHVNLVDGITDYSVGREEDGVTVGSFALISKKDGFSVLDLVNDADIMTRLTPRGDDVVIEHFRKSSGDLQGQTAQLQGAFSVHHLYESNPIGTPHSTNGDHGSGDNPQLLFTPPPPFSFQPLSFPNNGPAPPGAPNSFGNPGNNNLVSPILFEPNPSAPSTLPTLTVSVAITVSVSSAQEEQLLTATAMLNGHTQTSGITYQWQIFEKGKWQDIAGATGATLKLPERDDGKLIRVQATYSAGGQTVVADSAPTEVEENPILFVSETACHQRNADSVVVGFNSLVALNIFAREPGGGNVDVVISGLPSDVRLTDSHGDHLRIVDGSITLTQSELAGLTLHTGHSHEHILLTVTADNTEGGSTSAKLAIDVTGHFPHRGHDHDHDHRHDHDHGYDHGFWFDPGHRLDQGYWFDTDDHSNRHDRRDADHRFDRDHRFDHDRFDRFDWSDGDHRFERAHWRDADHRADDDRWFDRDHRFGDHRFDSDHRFDWDHRFAFDHGSDRWHWTEHGHGTDQHGEHGFEHAGSFDVDGAVFSRASVLIEPGGDLIGHGTVHDAIHNFGTVESKDGVLDIKGNVSGHGELKIADGSTLQLDGSDTNNVSFLNHSGHDHSGHDYSGNAGALVLNDAFDFSGKISDFSGHDSIDLKDVNFDHGHISVSYSHGTLTVSDGAQTAHIAFDGHYSLDSFHFSNDGHGGTLITEQPPNHPDPGTWHAGPSAGFDDHRHDAFPFQPGFGGPGVFGSGDKPDHGVNGPDFAHLQPLLQATNDGHDGGANPGHGEGPALVNVPVNGLQSSDFINHHT